MEVKPELFLFASNYFSVSNNEFYIGVAMPQYDSSIVSNPLFVHYKLFNNQLVKGDNHEIIKMKSSNTPCVKKQANLSVVLAHINEIDGLIYHRFEPLWINNKGERIFSYNIDMPECSYFKNHITYANFENIYSIIRANNQNYVYKINRQSFAIVRESILQIPQNAVIETTYNTEKSLYFILRHMDKSFSLIEINKADI